MYRHALALSGLIAILLLAACGSTQIGSAASSSGTPVSAAPTLAAAPGAAPPTSAPSASGTPVSAAPTLAAAPGAPPPTSAPGAAMAAPTAGQPAPAIKLEQVAGDFNAPVFVTHVGDDSSR